MLQLQWRAYAFSLPQAMVTSQGAWSERRGWLLRLQSADGRLGWGEAAELPQRGGALQASHLAPPQLLPEQLRRDALERWLPQLPLPLACALGMALAERDGLGCVERGGWLAAPPSAWLLPAGEAALPALDTLLERGGAVPATAARRSQPRSSAGAGPGPAGAPRAVRSMAVGMVGSRSSVIDLAAGLAMGSPSEVQGHAGSAGDARAGQGDSAAGPAAAAVGPGALRGGERPSADPDTCPVLTVKWKVAAAGDALERRVLEALLRRLPAGSRLRLDANGGWDRRTAATWAERLAGDPRLEWLEQPLPPHDQEGLESLAARVPLALDESLRDRPELIAHWSGWQVRRPLVEGDPRPLLQELERGRPRLMLSTAFETGIGRRLLQHLAGLQALGPTPTAPGLAPGWSPPGDLFADDPEPVWEAAR
ncbi:MAG: o-succinylbenzoate synthase [Cyanobium sp.]